MAEFQVRFIGKNGAAGKILINALTIRECEAKIKEQGGIVIEAKETQHAYNKRKKYPFPCLSEFTSLLSQLLDASLNIKDALDIIKTVAGRSDVRAVAEQISVLIGKGHNFNESLAMVMDGLPSVYNGLVSIGERTGDLPRAYKQLDSWLEDRKKIRDKITGALVYPIIVLSVALFGIIGISVFALPKLESIFSQLGNNAAEQLNRSMLSARISAFTISFIALFFIFLFLAARQARKKNAQFAEKTDFVLLNIPIIGQMIKITELFDFCFSMETLIAGGVPLDDALQGTSLTLGNRAFKKSVISIRNMVRNGLSLSQAIANEPAFPPFIKQWLAVGERTGQTFLVFGKMRAFYQALSEKKLNMALNIIEPGISIIIGIFMLVIVYLFVLPIFSSYGALL
jgi:type II secretory pathway component PulF